MSKISTITIHAGHNAKGKVACGASDYIDESKEARIIVKYMKKFLKKEKIKFYDCTVNNASSSLANLQQIVAKCNSHKRDLDVSIHFNACMHSPKDGKTKGTEVHIIEDSGIKGSAAHKIASNISKVTGLTNRGIKINKGLYVLNHTTAPALLVEVCFVDDRDDVNKYLPNKKEIARAIVKALKAV